MARSYAAIHQRVWADPEWRALDVNAQHLYFLLISQPQMNLAGVLPLQLRKWSSCVAGWDITDVATALDVLRHRRFVLVDEDTEEVLVRSLIRNDGSYRIPNVLKSLLHAAEGTQAAGLRRELSAELGRLDPLEGKKADESRGLIASTRLALGGFDAPPDPDSEPFPEGLAEGLPEGFVATHSPTLTATQKQPIAQPSGSGSGSGTSLSLVENLGGKSAPPPPDEPPLCAKHDGMDRDQVPGCRACKRLRENWEMARDEATKPKPLPPLCGDCDNRWVETDAGMARCPNCNPRAHQESA